MKELSNRDRLYNALVDCIKVNARDCEIGLVEAVLNEIYNELSMRTNRLHIDCVMDKIKPRE